ncbi:outer membrane protein [Methylocystis heyeri]|nr:outer membrane beta-barrel protein [Methylocystis heyeri]
MKARMFVFRGGAFACLLAAFSAEAADLPSLKAPIAQASPPPALWTGFYAGLNAGYGWGSNAANTAGSPLLDGIAFAANGLDPARQLPGTGLIPGVTALANSGVANIDQSGFIGGGQIGYNYQWGAHVVVGLEADFQGTTMQGNGAYAGVSRDSIAWKDPAVPGLLPCSTNGCNLNRLGVGGGQIGASTDWLGTVRGRIGYLATPDWLIYGTGGLAYGGVRASAAHSALTIGTLTGANDAALPVPFPYSQLNGTYFLPSAPGAAGYSGTRAGWTVGGGVEWLFAPQWSLKVEGLYYNLGSVSLRSSPVSLLSPLTINLGGVNVAAGQLLVANAPVTRITFDGALVRLGVNYRFNFW